MVSSTAKTVADYLAELEPERREVISHVRDLINQVQPVEGLVGTAYAFGFGASGGSPSYQWSVAAGFLQIGRAHV